jgi:hypothetical protein
MARCDLWETPAIGHVWNSSCNTFRSMIKSRIEPLANGASFVFRCRALTSVDASFHLGYWSSADPRIGFLVKTSMTRNEMMRPMAIALPRCQIASKSELW